MILQDPDNLSNIVRVFAQTQWQSSFLYRLSSILRHFGLGPKGLYHIVCLCGRRFRIFPVLFHNKPARIALSPYLRLYNRPINDNDYPRNS